jgi:hypothetical protein
MKLVYTNRPIQMQWGFESSHHSRTLQELNEEEEQKATFK